MSTVQAARSPWVSASWTALGTYVQLVVADADRAEAARSVAGSVLAQVDRACSRFRPDSDLVRANAGAGSWVEVDAVLLDALRAAIGAAASTDGLVDPTLGADLAALGYDEDLAAVRARTDDGPSALPRPVRTASWRDVRLDAGAVLVPAGLALDLGATGKAFAADLVARRVVAETGTALVVSLGGDVAAGAPDGHPLRGVIWPVEVAEHPGEPAHETTGVVAGTPAAALATSSTVARRWTTAGRTVHHLLDPRTGGPVHETYRTASVVAASCLAANTASTAALVLGARAPAWLEERGLGARLVTADGTVVRTPGWPA